MNNSKTGTSRRKPSGPQRSATQLDTFLKPGVLFRFPSDCEDLKMPATFISANFSNKIGEKTFENIDFTPSEFFSVKKNVNDFSSFEDLESISSSHSIRSISPISVPSSEISSKSSCAAPTISLHGSGNISKRRRCESCGTRKTPYWRDGWESGILLCNACGIRFHKYRKICINCRCVAKKDEKGYLHCPKCFDKL